MISCDKGLNEPRYASLKGIMQAKKKPIEIRTAADVGVEDSELENPKLVWESIELPAPRSGATLLEGEPQEAATKLVRMLRDDAKVI